MAIAGQTLPSLPSLINAAGIALRILPVHQIAAAAAFVRDVTAEYGICNPGRPLLGRPRRATGGRERAIEARRQDRLAIDRAIGFNSPGAAPFLPALFGGNIPDVLREHRGGVRLRDIACADIFDDRDGGMGNSHIGSVEYINPLHDSEPDQRLGPSQSLQLAQIINDFVQYHSINHLLPCTTTPSRSPRGHRRDARSWHCDDRSGGGRRPGSDSSPIEEGAAEFDTFQTSSPLVLDLDRRRHRNAGAAGGRLLRSRRRRLRGVDGLDRRGRRAAGPGPQRQRRRGPRRRAVRERDGPSGRRQGLRRLPGAGRDSTTMPMGRSTPAIPSGASSASGGTPTGTATVRPASCTSWRTSASARSARVRRPPHFIDANGNEHRLVGTLHAVGRERGRHGRRVVPRDAPTRRGGRATPRARRRRGAAEHSGPWDRPRPSPGHGAGRQRRPHGSGPAVRRRTPTRRSARRCSSRSCSDGRGATAIDPGSRGPAHRRPEAGHAGARLWRSVHRHRGHRESQRRSRRPPGPHVPGLRRDWCTPQLMAQSHLDGSVDVERLLLGCRRRTGAGRSERRHRGVARPVSPPTRQPVGWRSASLPGPIRGLGVEAMVDYQAFRDAFAAQGEDIAWIVDSGGKALLAGTGRRRHPDRRGDGRCPPGRRRQRHPVGRRRRRRPLRTGRRRHAHRRRGRRPAGWRQRRRFPRRAARQRPALWPCGQRHAPGRGGRRRPRGRRRQRFPRRRRGQRHPPGRRRRRHPAGPRAGRHAFRRRR